MSCVCSAAAAPGHVPVWYTKTNQTVTCLIYSNKSDGDRPGFSNGQSPDSKACIDAGFIFLVACTAPMTCLQVASVRIV